MAVCLVLLLGDVLHAETCDELRPPSLQACRFTRFLTLSSSDSFSLERLLDFSTWMPLKQRSLHYLHPECCPSPSAHSIPHPRPLTLTMSFILYSKDCQIVKHRERLAPCSSLPLESLSHSSPPHHPSIPLTTLKFILLRVVSLKQGSDCALPCSL